VPLVAVEFKRVELATLVRFVKTTLVRLDKLVTLVRLVKLATFVTLAKLVMLVALDITLIGIVVGSTQLNNDINKPNH
jgi:hypothetical protein